MTETTKDQFIFFCVNVGNENLLKEEIKEYYPELTLSYSRKGFLTFKNKGVRFDVDTISELQVTFTTRAGICLGKSKPENLKSTVEDSFIELGLKTDSCVIHNFSVNTDYLYESTTDFSITTNEYSADGKLVLNIISLGEKEIWFGIHRVSKGITRYPNSHVDLSVPKSSPSMAYLKIAETTELYALNFSKRDTWLDFGCSPGGSSAYLLSTGAKVWGIDTADVDKKIYGHRNFKFIKSSVQDLSQEGLPDDISWVHADININPKQSIKEVLRLCKKYNSSLKGIMFTIQMVNPSMIQRIEEFEDIFYDWGFLDMISRQVPSHKKEYILIAQRGIKRNIRKQ
jgi:23S rRNA (cytidine2498-2'-O)-methyltransferase